MNRNYLPPSLKHTMQVSGSPPSNSYVMPQQRRYGRACKLPTVQEVMGKFDFVFLYFRENGGKSIKYLMTNKKTYRHLFVKLVVTILGASVIKVCN